MAADAVVVVCLAPSVDVQIVQNRIVRTIAVAVATAAAVGAELDGAERQLVGGRFVCIAENAGIACGNFRMADGEMGCEIGVRACFCVIGKVRKTRTCG